MRPIEFRGKSLDNGELVYGYLVEIQDLRFAIKDTVYNVNNGRIDIIPSEVNPSTVGQFTGLTDKKGKKIFEGDNLIYIGTNMSSMEVKFLDGVFVGEGPFNTRPLIDYINAHDFQSIEIIGNIHDNPELLNKQQ